MDMPEEAAKATSPALGGTDMNRFLFGVVGLLVAIWLVFAVFNAVKGLAHLALVVAILIVAYNLLMGLRQRWNDPD